MTERNPLEQELVLAGTHVRLEPLRAEHVGELLPVALDPDLWRWTLNSVETPEDLRAYIATALEERARGESYPFLIRDAEARAVGSTRYARIDLPQGRLEIGWTWIGGAWQRTALNTEAKYLLLRHAFEAIGVRRVELRTDALNERSRRAILRIGAREEATLRSHAVTSKGRIRDTVIFSILDAEWPDVRRALERKLGRSG